MGIVQGGGVQGGGVQEGGVQGEGVQGEGVQEGRAQGGGWLARAIIRVVDYFYLPFARKIVDQKTFRYAAIGALNLSFGVVLYWFLYHYVLGEGDTNFWGVITVSAPILAFLINFVVTFFTGFWLTRNVAFSDSRLHGGVQLLRYSLVVGLNICINYFGLKVLVESFGLYPTPSYMSLQVLTVLMSYLASRFYIFR